MENKKDIGAAFKEKFDRVDHTPNDKVWESINSDLEKKKKRRFLLYFLSGAMVLSTLLLLFLAKDAVFGNDKPSKRKEPVVEKRLSTASENSSVHIDRDTILKSKNTRTTKATVTKKLVRQTDEMDEYEVVARYKIYIKKTKTWTAKKTVKLAADKKTERKITEKTSVSKNKATKSKKNAKQVASKPIEHANKKSKTNPHKTNPQQIVPEIKSAEKTTIASDQNNISGKTVPRNNPVDATPTDSVKPNATQNDTISKKKKASKPHAERKPQQPEKNDQVYLSAFIGPMYYNNLSKSSPLMQDGDFSKKGSVNLNYSIHVRAMFTDNFGLRLGIAKTDTEFTTTIPKDASSPWILGNTSTNLDGAFDRDSFNAYFADAGKIDLIQQTDYLEIPIETYFVLKKNKIGIAGFAGFSTYFLTKNSVSASSTGHSAIEIGESSAKNVTFSLNLGLVLNYKLNEKFDANLSPWLKYQMKPFENSFNPVLGGLQLGLTHKL